MPLLCTKRWIVAAGSNWRSERRLDVARKGGCDAGNCCYLVLACVADALDAAEVGDEGLLSRRADALDLVERRLDGGLLALLAVERDGEAVRFVADALN